MKTTRKGIRWIGLLLMVMLTVFGMACGAMAADTPQSTNELDGSKIEGVFLEWVTLDSSQTAEGETVPASEKDDVAHLYLSATTNNELVMIYRAEVQLSGQFDYDPGDVTIRIPAQIWPTRVLDENGVGQPDFSVLQGELELPVPEAPSTKADFNWQLIGDEYVLTNTRKLGAASSVSIEVAVRGLYPINMVDMVTSKDITVHCEVVTNRGNTIEMSSKAINAQVDTTAKLTYVYKDGEIIEDVSKVPQSLLANLPADDQDPSNYVYAKWHTYQSHQNNQPYSLEIKDMLSEAYELGWDGNRIHLTDGVFLGSETHPGTLSPETGVDFAAPVVNNAKDTTTQVQYDKTVYMWSAYRKDALPETDANEEQRAYYLENKITWALTETDDEAQAWDTTDPQKVNELTDTVIISYSPMKWTVPPGSFIVQKWTEERPNKDWDYGLALNRLEREQDVDMNFLVQTVGYGWPWTSELAVYEVPGTSEEELRESYGKLGWKQTTEDYRTIFNYETEPLTADDFEFKALRVTRPTTFRYDKMDNGQYGYVEDFSLQVPDLMVEYQLNGGSEWIPAAKVVYSASGMPTIHTDPAGNAGVEEATTTITFPENTTDVRWYYISNQYTDANGQQVTLEHCDLGGVTWDMYPTITLKASDRVRGVVAKLFDESNTPATKFKNDVRMNAFQWKDNRWDQIAHFADASRASLEGAGYGVSMTKSARYESDPENEQVLIHYTLTTREQSNLLTLEDYNEAVAIGAVPAETSGVWYDLLPLHVVPKLDSVQVRAGDTAKNVYAIENYNGSGRYLLVVEVDLTPQPRQNNTDVPFYDSPTITFDAVYPVLDLEQYGNDLDNYAAFESTVDNLRKDDNGVPTLGNIEGQRGEPDDPTGGNNITTPAMPEDIVKAIANLDPATDENRFVYATTNHIVSALDYALSDLKKQVKNDLGGNWTQGLADQEQVTVFEGHPYTYSLTVSSGAKSVSKDIILYDTIENYKIPSADSNDGTKKEDYKHVQDRKDWSGAWNGVGQWRGTLERVELGQLIDAGVAPVLYYSTIPGLQFAETKSEMTDGNYEEDTQILSSGYYDVSNTEYWTKAELVNGVWTVPDGVNVSAVAVDARKNTAGKEFILMPDEHLSAYLRMRAPDDDCSPDVWNAKGAYTRMADDESQVDWEAAQDPANNMYAFNNSRLRLMQGEYEDEKISWTMTQPRMIRNDYTRVGIVPSSIKVKKEWLDDDNHDNLRPDSITVQLLRKVAGTADAPVPVLDADNQPIVLNLGGENDWAVTLFQVDVVNEEGMPYVYSFVEEPMEGYETTVVQVRPGEYVIRNTHPNEVVDLSGSKVWNDSGDMSGLRPESVQVTLYRDGQLYQTLTVRGTGDTWKYSFGKLPRYERGGREYVYRIEETYVPKYIDRVEGQTITNTLYPYGDLCVTKQVLGATSDAAAGKEFTFTLTLLQEKADPDAPDKPLEGKFAARVDENVDGTWTKARELQLGNGDTFTLKGNQRLLITNLPSECRYIVEEQPTDGFTSSSENADGFIRSGREAEAAFTNTYSAKGFAQLEADKRLTGTAIQKNKFKFEVVDRNQGSETEGQVITVARVQQPEEAATGGLGESVESESKVLFGALRYTHEDHGKTFLYELREVDEELGGYTSDSKTYLVEVAVTDNGDGTLTVTPAYKDANGNSLPALPQYENQYNASGEVSLKVWKTLDGREPGDKTFTFELVPCDEKGTPAAGAETSTATSDAAGVAEFAALSFTQDDVSLDPEKPAVYYYLASEQAGTDETIIYSTQKYLFKITVHDNGDGTLSFEQETYAVENGAVSENQMVPVFANKIKPGALKVEKQVPADSTGGDPEQEFTFHVKLSGDAAADMDYTLTVPEVPDDGEEEEEEEPAAPTLPPFVATQRIEPKTPRTPADPLPTKTLTAPKDVVKTNYVHATADQLKGDAYAVLDTATKTLTFFRSEDGKDLQGNTMTFADGAKRAENTEKGLIYYTVDEAIGDITGLAWPWNVDKDSITAVKMEGYIRPTNCNNFFRDLKNVTSYDLSKFDTSKTTDTSYMFWQNSSLTSIDISGFDTSNAYSMTAMFCGCKGLTSIDLSTLDLTKARDISRLIGSCSGLTSVDLSYLHTEKVQNLSRLLEGCSGLTSVDLSTLDTSSATSLAYMFNGCTNLTDTDIDITYLKTGNCTNFTSMFAKCAKLEKLDLRTFDTSNAQNMAGMFEGCTNLKEIDMSSFNTGNVSQMESMFKGCTALESLDLSNFNTAKVKNMSNMFNGMTCKQPLDLSTFNTSSVTNMSYMFNACNVPADLDLRTFDTSEVTLMNHMFYNYKPVSKLDISFFDTANVTDMRWMFRSFGPQDVLDLRNFNTSKVKDMQYMFASTKVPQLILTSFDTSKVTTMQGMFYDYRLGSGPALDLSNFTLESCTTMQNMFSSCMNLEYLDISGMDTVSSGIKINNSGTFTSTLKLKTVVIGSNAVFPTSYPKASTTAPYNGKWVMVDDDTQVLESAALFGEGNHAGTWVWQEATYKLNFLPGEKGSGAMASVNPGVGSDYTFAPKFTSAMYEVSGFKDQNGKEYTLNADGTCTIPANTYPAVDGKEQEVTLTAQWKEKQLDVTVTEDGATFKLKAGESITFNNLPAGTAYEVWEELPDGWVLVSKTNDAGMIESLKTTEAVFTNKYDPTKATVSLRASKQLDGEAVTGADAYTFTLSDATGVLQTKKNAAGGGVVFDTITYGEAGDYTYTIKEVAGGDSTIAYDETEYTVTVKVTDDAAGELSAAVSYAKGDVAVEADELVFRNTTKPGSLKLTKEINGQLTDAAREKAFTFEITFMESALQPWSGTLTIGGSDDQAQVTDGVLSVELKGGESLTLTGIPAGLTYEVKETGDLTGWTISDQQGASGQIKPNETAECAMTNTYNASGSLALQISKKLMGRELRAGEFTFQLVDGNNQVVGTGTNDAEGVVRFEPIEYTAEGQYSYAIVEVPGEEAVIEYSTERIEVTVDVEDQKADGQLTCTATYPANDAVITNRVKSGALAVKKQVESINPDHLTNEQYQFSIVVSLTNPDGTPYQGVVYARPDMSADCAIEVRDGTVPGTLRHDQTAILYGIPEGVRYEVTELDTQGFTASYEGETGTFEDGVMAETTITNTYHAKGEFVMEAVKKLVDGDGNALALEAGQFTFELTDENGTIVTATNDADGNVVFDAILFDETDVGEHDFVLYERNDGKTGYVYSMDEHDFQVTVKDNGDGTLSATAPFSGEDYTFENKFSNVTSIPVEKVWQDEENKMGVRPESVIMELYRNKVKQDAVVVLSEENGWKDSFEDLPALDEDGFEYTYEVREVPVAFYSGSSQLADGVTVFTNTLETQGVLRIGKEEVGIHSWLGTKEFQFTVTLTNQGVPYQENVILEKNGSYELIMPDAEGKIILNLKHGEQAQLLGLPYGLDYQTAEKAESGFTTQCNGEETAESADTVKPGVLHQANYVNSYKAEGGIELGATKKLNGRALEEAQFSFELKDASGNVIEEVTNAADGSIAFTKLTYTEADLASSPISYTVSEVIGTAAGYTYDETEYAITVTVTDNGDGTLKVVASDNAKALDFVNSYEAKGETSFSGKKTLEGRELAEGEFSFTLYDGEGNAIETVQNTADGSFAFTTLEYIRNDNQNDLGEHTYTVREVQGDLGGVTYDETEYTITVTVTDNGDGTLEVVASENATALNFVNTYEAEGGIELGATKKLNGRALEDAQFSFELKDASGNVIEEVTNAADGSIAFTKLTYTEADLASSPISYTVSEVIGTAAGYTYDETEYPITVTVTDNGDGTLKVVASDNAKALDFVNSYEAKGETSFSGKKTLEGRELAEGEFSFTLYDGEGNAIETVQNTADGSFAFTTLEYIRNANQNDLGEHTYTVKEVAGELGGVTYDEKEYTITVTVTDNGDGTLKVVASENATALDFTNSYDADGELTLRAVKTVNGAEPRADEVFTFELCDAAGKVLQTAKNEQSEITFEALKYTEADVGKSFLYTVREQQAEKPGYTTDATVYTVAVWVADAGDGSLKVTKAISSEGKAVEAMAFENTYEAEGQWKPEAIKTVNGAEPREDQVYEFTLTDENGSTILAENEKGEIIFDTLIYDLTDAGKTYTYTVREITTLTDLLTTDESVYTVNVTVTDNKDGTLAVKPVINKDGETAEEITFENKLTTLLTISKTVEGIETTETFPMTVKLYNANGTEAEGEYAYTGDAEGKLKSGGVIELGHGQSVTISGLLPGMTYTVTEAATAAFETTVNGSAGNAAEGTLAEDTNEVSFVNKFKTTMFMVKKSWQGGGGGAIELTLYANGEKMEPQPVYSRDENVYVYTDLPMYDAKEQLIVYSAKEKYVDGFLTIYSNVAPYADETKAIYDGGTIINKAIVKADFSVKKEWTGLAEGETAPEIMLVLYCNGVATDIKTPKPDRNGWYKYYDLPGEVDGKAAVYTVKELPVEGYETSYKLANGTSAEYADNGGIITNAKIPQTGDETPLALWLTLMGASATMLVLLLKRRKA